MPSSPMVSHKRGRTAENHTERGRTTENHSERDRETENHTERDWTSEDHIERGRGKSHTWDGGGSHTWDGGGSHTWGGGESHTDRTIIMLLLLMLLLLYCCCGHVASAVVFVSSRIERGPLCESASVKRSATCTASQPPRRLNWEHSQAGPMQLPNPCHGLGCSAQLCTGSPCAKKHLIRWRGFENGSKLHAQVTCQARRW